MRWKNSILTSKIRASVLAAQGKASARCHFNDPRGQAQEAREQSDRPRASSYRHL